MKTFKGQNHYEVLNISPGADIGEIKRAYRDALALYDEDALATYALFSDAQRAEILEAVESAFQTLVDEGRRAAYNQQLLASGEVNASVFSVKDQKYLDAHAGGRSSADNLAQWVRKKSAETEVKAMVESLLSAERVTGPELRAMREAFGIEPAEIYALTKISGNMLAAIENDRFDVLPAEIFIKQFLTSLAEIFQLDPGPVVDGYLANMADRG